MRGRPESNLRTYAELFCGCGGLSLGLQNSGFKCLLANDVSPMAAETYAFNLVEGARDGAPPSPEKLGGDYFTFLVDPVFSESTSSWEVFRNWKGYRNKLDDVSTRAISQLERGDGSHLIVGDASLLAQQLAKRTPKRLQGIDLLSGGPPCQSFSLAGKREKDHPRNKLFLSFVQTAELLGPKVILFENVHGITSPFKGEDGTKYHPWFEVCKAFRRAGFIPIPSLVDASHFGIPQARRRFVMIALREDIADKAVEKVGLLSPLANAIEVGRANYGKKMVWRAGDDKRLIFRFDQGRNDWPELLFPFPKSKKVFSVEDAIGDIASVGDQEGFEAGDYSKRINRLLKNRVKIKRDRLIKNHGRRRHGHLASARFRLLRVLQESGWNAKGMTEVKSNPDKVYELIKGKSLIDPSSGKCFQIKSNRTGRLESFLNDLASSKITQKCLVKGLPAPSQLSIPDDYVHWSHDRVLTIREMARIQSFPDWFVFCSKETTGGKSRAFEVPQYTQVGNAVPPLLGRSFGESIHRFLDEVDS